MRQHDEIVKDKRIMSNHGGEPFRATVEYFKDCPDRDNDEPRTHDFTSMREAQKWLEKFPRDAWTGNEISVIIARELDKGRRRVTKRKGFEKPDHSSLYQLCSSGDCVRLFGRSLVGAMCHAN